MAIGQDALDHVACRRRPRKLIRAQGVWRIRFLGVGWPDAHHRGITQLAAQCVQDRRVRDTANTFLDCFTKFEGVCQDQIEVVQRGVNSYHNGIQGMQGNEKQMMGYFPG